MLRHENVSSYWLLIIGSIGRSALRSHALCLSGFCDTSNQMLIVLQNSKSFNKSIWLPILGK